jgi:hypothetical protein
MLFRRKKQPDTDKRELTEALRSLEDLIAESPDPTSSKPSRKTVANEPGEAGKKTVPERKRRPDYPAQSDATEQDHVPDISVDDDVPLLTKVAYMPIPRVTAGDKTAARRSTSIDTAHQTIAKELVNTVEHRLDTDGQPLDPDLTRDLQDAVSASLEDWSIRTQEILLKRFTPPTKK